MSLLLWNCFLNDWMLFFLKDRFKQVAFATAVDAIDVAVALFF